MYHCPRCKEKGDQSFWESHRCGGAPDEMLLAMTPQAAERLAAGLLPRIGEMKAATQDKVAVIPIHGAISRQPGWFGPSQSEIRTAMIEAVNDPNVAAIVLDIDSPGGDAAGVADLAGMIASFRGTKPIVSVTGGMMASAALWIGAAADRIVASADALVGSIGAVIVHTGFAKMLAEEGIEVKIIRSGENKFEGSGLEPLSEGALGRFQARVDEVAASFKAGLREMRGITKDAAFGKGEVFSAKEAMARGLVDEIGTLEGVLNQLRGESPEGDAMNDQEKAELDRLREQAEHWKTVETRQLTEKFDKAKSAVLDPLRDQVRAGTLPPAVLEEISTAIEGQRKDYAEDQPLAIPAALLGRMTPTVLPQGQAGGDLKPEPKGTLRPDAELTRAIQEYQAQHRCGYLEASAAIKMTRPELAERYWASTAESYFHNISERRA